MIVENLFEFSVSVFKSSFYISLLTICLFCCLWAYLRIKIKSKFKNFEKVSQAESKIKKKRIAFFHPFCNSGGGGEKVLFIMLKALLKKYNDQVEIAVITGDRENEEEILEKTKRNFDIDIPLGKIKFVKVFQREILEPKRHFTMILQILGTFLYTIKILIQYPPNVFFDTTGFSFSYFIVKSFLPECKVIAYIHYPFISHDMLDSVKTKEKKFNNSGRIADSIILSQFKVGYYKILLFLYSRLERSLDYCFTNSTWTDTHIKALWPRFKNKSVKLYPPCNIEEFLNFPIEEKEKIMLSFAQFRPEKNHEMQIEIYRRIKEKYPETNLKFVIMGSCRNRDDELIYENLVNIVKSLKLEENIIFKKNLKFDEIKKTLSKASIGIHTMKAEHFGITIVEMMASGLLTIAHNSAGPKFDIIRERSDNQVGFLCENLEDYVNSVSFCLDASNDIRIQIINNARKEARKFDNETFENNFILEFDKFLKSF